MAALVAVVPSIAASTYLGVLTTVSLAPTRPTKPSLHRTRFAVIVPAHNEALVIGRTLDSMRLLEYPADRFEVHVVADNCTDLTTEIVKSSGFSAHERVDADNPGKGTALNWLVDRLEASTRPFDAYVVVDADTVLDPNFLAAMDSAIESGARVAQGHYSVLEPGSSPAAGLRFAALACRHHVRPLGRTRLGASCGLYGNGMMFSRELLATHRWSNHLVEDAEFQMELLLDDTLVRYVPNAKLSAEMPNTLEASVTQNERWERGRIQVARRYIPILSRRLAQRRTRRRIAHLDAIVDHLVPPLSVLAAVQLVAFGASQIAWIVSRSESSRLLVRAAVASIAVFVGHVLISLALVRAPLSVVSSLIRAPQVVLWKLGIWTRMTSTTEVAWERTERNQPATNLARVAA